MALIMALQRSTIYSIMAPGVLCRTVQELHRCLTPLLEKGDLLDLEMLDMVKKDPLTPAPAERASSLIPRAEGLIGIAAPNELPALEPKEAAPSEELALVQRRRLLGPPGFILSWADESAHPSRGSRLASVHTPGNTLGSLLGPYLLGVPVGDHLSLS